MSKTDPQIARQILNGLTEPIQPVERSANYTLGMFGAAFVMIFMFVSYMCALAGLFWLCLNLGNHLFSVGSPGGPGFWGFIVWGTVLLSAASVFFALIKPIFIRRDHDFEELELRPEQEPLLFEFVNRICQAVGSEKPSKIVVDPHVNAGASFANSALDNRMRLVIGLPLVLGMDTRQFAGVLAHEFGHFSQAGGMRLSYFVRSLDQWFYEASTMRDAWDYKVEEWSVTFGFPFNIVFYIVRFAVWTARYILYLLVMAGHFFVSRLLQQMEFDADRYEARLAGSQVFAKTARKLQLLHICHDKTLEDLDHYRRTRQLPDDLIALLVDNEKGIDEEKFRELENELLNLKTHWSDSHPSDRDRIANVAKENASGVFVIEYPASVLFSDAEALCKILTLEIYKDNFGDEFKKSEVKNTTQLIAEREIRRKEGKAALRFVLEQFCGYDTFLFPRTQLGQAINSNEYKVETTNRRKYMMDNVRAYAKIRQTEDNLKEDMASNTCAQRLIEAGFDLSNAGDIFKVKSLQQAHQMQNQLLAQDQTVKSQVAPFRQVLGSRMIDALEFMRSQQMFEQTGEPPAVAQEIQNILAVWNCISGLRTTFDLFTFELRVNGMLLSVAEDHLDERLMNSINAALGRLTDFMLQIQRSTVSVMYPFEHGDGEVSLAHFLVPELPKTQNIGATMDAAIDMDKNMEFLLRRCVSRLGALAEKVEQVFGFEPLETPAEVKMSAMAKAKEEAGN